MASKNSVSSSSVIRKNNEILDISKFTLALSYDHSCNLACRSCRKEHVTIPPGNKATLDLIHSEVKRALPVINSFIIGYGEVLFSKYYQEIVFEANNNDSIKIFTNGMMFNQETWAALKAKYKHISLIVSVDGATKKTFEYLRGGNFDTLYKNLEMAAGLRKANEIKHFETNFVVQKENFREMIAFIVMCKKLYVDLICFNKINNYTFSPEEFNDIDVYNPGNKYYEEFSLMLNNPIFRSKGIYVKNIENIVDVSLTDCPNISHFN